MPRVVIFSGTDQCGKTEMAHELSDRSHAVYFKSSLEKENFIADRSEYFVGCLRYLEPFFIDFIVRTGTKVILDRSWPEEFVYSQLFDRRTDWDQLTKVDRLYASAGTRIVIPYRSSYVGRCDEDAQGKIDDKKMEETDKLYRRFFEWSRCKCLLLNVDDEDLDREMRDICSFLGVTEHG